MPRKRKAIVATVAVSVFTLAACGGGDSGGGNPAAQENLGSRGPITYVQGKDNSGTIAPIVKKWNADHPDEKVTVKEQTDEADQQREDLVRNLEAQNADYDVVSVDLIWNTEFAAKGWLQPLEGDLAIDTEPLLDATVASGQYEGKQYGAPWLTDGGMLYYRKDLVKTPPKTWDEMMGMCSIADDNNMGCYAGQFSKYEGLTVNVAEAINGASGSIVGDDGVTPTVDTPEAATGLGNLADAYADGNIPKQAITYTEEEGRIAFEAGKLLFLRNWPYVYSLASTEGSSKVKGKFGVAPLPGTDGIGASALGGHNLAISAYSDNKATAVDFIKFMESEESQRFFVTKGSAAPSFAALYEDAQLAKDFPYLPVLKLSLDNAVPRPITPFYPDVTLAITENGYAAIKGDASVDEALTNMQAAIKTATSGD